MVKREKVAVFFFALTLISALSLWITSGVMVRFENGAKVNVEVVKEPLEITTGLMFRDKLGKDKGMLFSYGYDDRHTIWMKNMKFSIDILWIDSTNRVVHVAGNVEPCVKEPCPVYIPSADSRYVLEVNANFAEENEIIPGHEVVIYQPSLF
ncbi:MAG: DUF192 domain-containing protein [Candidatus Hydrothermarchaeales archaeon]